ncbi:MAG: hypothetical protein ACXIUZ_08955 [Lysobacteraceae bacterium]
MPELAARVRDLCLFRIGPQDLPYSLPDARLLSALLMLLAGVGLAGHGVAVVDMLPRLLLALAFLLLPAWLLLRLRGRPERYVQTLTAIAGVGVLYNLLVLPLAMLVQGADPRSSPVAGLLAWLVIALTFWRIAVSGHIWRHALDIPFAFGALLASVLFMAQILLVRWLFVPVA